MAIAAAIAGISAVGSIAGGALAARGASKQAEAAERSSALAVGEQRRQFDVTQRNLAPWLTAGTQAIQMLQFLLGLGVPPQQAAQIAQQTSAAPSDQFGESRASVFNRLLGFGDGRPTPFIDMVADGQGVFEPSDIRALVPGRAMTTVPVGAPGGFAPGDFGSLSREFGTGDFEADPGYAFRLSEGFKALERSAAARGTVLSGGTLRELARYNQGFASNEFQNVFNRFQTERARRFNQLASIAGLGQTTAAQLGQFGAQSAGNIGQLLVGGQTAAAAARASGYQNWANAIQGAAQAPLNWLLLSQLGQRQPSSNVPGG